jgi:hypothetical protein
MVNIAVKLVVFQTLVGCDPLPLHMSTWWVLLFSNVASFNCCSCAFSLQYLGASRGSLQIVGVLWTVCHTLGTLLPVLKRGGSWCMLVRRIVAKLTWLWKAYNFLHLVCSLLYGFLMWTMTKLAVFPCASFLTFELSWSPLQVEFLY